MVLLYMIIYYDRDPTNSHAALDALEIEATFDGDFCSGKNCIKISDTTEESFNDVGEWSEYIATFFNKEQEVKGLADTARARCVHTCTFEYMHVCAGVNTLHIRTRVHMYAHCFSLSSTCTNTDTSIVIC